MLSLKIICVGKLKEKFYLDAAAEYQKRLGGLCRLEVEELPEARLSSEPSEAEVEAAMHREAESIFLRIPSGAVTVALCIEGKTIDSVGFSQFLEMCALKGKAQALLYHRRLPGSASGGQGPGGAAAQLFPHDLSSSSGAGHAAGAALPRLSDPDGKQVS